MEGQAGGVVIELCGNRRAVIDGCDGVLEYGPEAMLFRAGRQTVRLTGRELRLCRLTENSAVVEGFLTAVEYL